MVATASMLRIVETLDRLSVSFHQPRVFRDVRTSACL